jgi:hypothetical protein
MSENTPRPTLHENSGGSTTSGPKGHETKGAAVPRTSARGQRGRWFSRCGVLALVVSTLLGAGLWRLIAPRPVLVTAPVTEAEVVNLRLDHYFTPDRQAHEPDFEWTFTETDFVLKRATGPIPADLLAQLPPAHPTADEIRGKWRLAKDGQQLILMGITAGEKGGKAAVTLLIYKTASSIVRIGEPQYVFSIGRRARPARYHGLRASGSDQKGGTTRTPVSDAPPSNTPARAASMPLPPYRQGSSQTKLRMVRQQWHERAQALAWG